MNFSPESDPNETEEACVPANRLTIYVCFYLAIYSLLLLTSCGPRPGQALLDQEKFKRVYIALIISSLDSVDSGSPKLPLVLDSLKISCADYDKSLSYYKNKPDAWLEIIQESIQELERRKSNPQPADSLKK